MSEASPAYQIGLREGDRIVEAAGQPIRSLGDLDKRQRAVPKTQPLELVVERAGQPQHVTLPPQRRGPVFGSINHAPEPPIVGGVATGMPAYKAGLKEGDRILAVADRPIQTWDELPAAFHGQVDRPVKLTIERSGHRFDVTVTPMDPEGRGRQNGRIGIEPLRRSVYVVRYGLLESADYGWRATGALVSSVYAGMWLTVSRPLYYREYVGGPLFIAQAALDQARHGLDAYLRFMALINVAIMAFNLLPLPVLDGGHILLAVLEAVRRQAISARSYLRFQKVGLAVLGTLLVIILANDPLRLVQRHRAIDQQTTPTERPVAPASP
jgi:regulator of sigma E protease